MAENSHVLHNITRALLFYRRLIGHVHKNCATWARGAWFCSCVQHNSVETPSKTANSSEICGNLERGSVKVSSTPVVMVPCPHQSRSFRWMMRDTGDQTHGGPNKSLTSSPSRWVRVFVILAVSLLSLFPVDRDRHDRTVARKLSVD